MAATGLSNQKSALFGSGSASRAGSGKSFADIPVPSESTRLLANSVKLTRETEVIGLQTEQDLEIQREYLEDAHEKVGFISELTFSAKRTLFYMQYKAYRRKVVLWFIVIVLFIANAYVFLKMWFNHGKLYST